MSRTLKDVLETFTTEGELYERMEGGKIEHAGPADFTPEQLLASDANAGRPPESLEDAIEFLKEALGEPRWAVAVRNEAQAAGISERTLRRAKTALDVKSVHLPRGWQWMLP